MSVSIVKQLKKLIEDDFPEYIPVSSIAKASGFDILNLCHPESDIQGWMKKCSRIFGGQDDQPKFTSLGNIIDYCSLEEENNVINNKISQEDVVEHDATKADYSKDVKGSISGKVPTSEEVTIEYQSTMAERSQLNLGIIKRKSISYKALNKYIKKISEDESSSYLYNEVENGIFIIYDVLTAEKLQSQNYDNCSGSGSASVTVPVLKSTGDGSNAWHQENYSHLTRSSEMGRFPIAFQCGKIRRRRKGSRKGRSKQKYILELVKLTKFYQPFKYHAKANKSPSSSQEA